MSLAELKEQVVELTEEERLDLEAWLVRLRLSNDREWLAEINRRMRDMDAGKKVSQDEVLRVHRELLAKGE
jgi:hypothetical protein